jgi:hypothetical protein
MEIIPAIDIKEGRCVRLMQGKFEGIYFNDSDVYKIIEGASYSLMGKPNKELDAYLDSVIAIIITGQILDRESKKNLTLDRLKELRKVDPNRLPLENAIPMGKGKRKLYVFTDPQCHFCSQLHEELKLVKDLQTFFFLYPLNPASCVHSATSLNV